MLKAKILFVGPCESGKTVLANFLTESSDITEYNPTQGVRILEFENPHVTSNNKGTGCEFELWDCGGDSKPHFPCGAPPLNKLKLVHSNLEEDPEEVRVEFIKYLKSIISSLSESRDREEMLIIT
ncbi:intraflagellar transport protein 22 homolog isoform X1 [Cricetulus griseus]|uniref:intraflagellar transport protein 22 homolog isoform X1 n=1 Tax=Cricetulus griseus TaxID=10029 RepID=UPI0004545FD5|nr:intraflagellar transport protein 22 homolog isoform X1 [Cricetulus griseus]